MSSMLGSLHWLIVTFNIPLRTKIRSGFILSPTGISTSSSGLTCTCFKIRCYLTLFLVGAANLLMLGTLSIMVSNCFLFRTACFILLSLKIYFLIAFIICFFNSECMLKLDLGPDTIAGVCITEDSRAVALDCSS